MPFRLDHNTSSSICPVRSAYCTDIVNKLRMHRQVRCRKHCWRSHSVGTSSTCTADLAVLAALIGPFDRVLLARIFWLEIRFLT